MKHSRLFLVIALLAVVAFGTSAYAAITGSKHDLSGVTAYGAPGQICIFCHAPHGAGTGATTGVPLWSHATTAQTFQMYSTTVAGTTPATTPNGISKACLSCHDGVTAVDSYTGHTTGTVAMATATAIVGTDLRNDHPISIAYGGAAKGLVAVASLPASIKLYDTDKVECASCHDVHNNGPSGAGHLLRVSNASSGLCTACHAK